MTHRFLAERGLAIKLSELYETLQDCLDDNFVTWVKSIILKPGLRIAEGDEFLVRQEGDTLRIKVGAIVFPDYDIFVPDSSASDMILPLSGVPGINEPGNEYAIYIVGAASLSHPYRRSGTSGTFYTVRQNAVKAVIRKSPTGGLPVNHYLLAKVTVGEGGGLTIEDQRMSSVLTLVSKYAREDWLEAHELNGVRNVSAQLVFLEDFRHSSVQGHSFNDQSLPINRRRGPALEITWDAPTAQQLDAINGVMYYKVVATPVYGDETIPDAAIEQIVIVDRISSLQYKLPANRTGCLVPCELGVKYEIMVYKVSDVLDMKISSSGDPIYVLAGTNPHMAPLEDVTLQIGYALASTQFVKISSNVTPAPNTTIQVFAYEYSIAVPYYMGDVKWQIYEGPVRDILYRVPKGVAGGMSGVAVLYRVKGKNSQTVVETFKTFRYATLLSRSEKIIEVSVPDSKTGWPGRDLPSSALSGKNVKANGSSATISTGAGHNRASGDYIYITNSTISALSDGAYKVIGTSRAGTDVTIDVGGTGASGTGTLDVPGNAKIKSGTSNPVILEIPTSSPLAGKFSAGNKLVVGNSSNSAHLPNGTYDIVAVSTTTSPALIHLDRTSSTTTGGYCDVVAPEEIEICSFALDADMALVRARVVGYQGQVLHADAFEHGSVARYTIYNAAGSLAIDVPRSGGAYKEFNEPVVFEAGSPIRVKLKRGDDNLPQNDIDASRYRLFLYFKRAI